MANTLAWILPEDVASIMQVHSPKTLVRRTFLTPTAIAHAVFVPTGLVTVLLGPLLPTLSARWSLSDTQAGYLVTAQFIGSLLSTLSSGIVLPRIKFRWSMVIGLMFMAIGSATLMAHSYLWGLAAVFCNGFGNGMTVPTGNLLVARVTAHRSSSSLNVLNFSWSAGAVACPFLLAAFQQAGRISAFLLTIAGFLGLLIVVLLTVPINMPESSPESDSTSKQSRLHYLGTSTGMVLGALFFVYAGAENALGTWLASYANRVSDPQGAGWITIPSYFYGALLLGRVTAPVSLRQISDVTQARLGAVLACAGVGALLYSRTLLSIAVCSLLVGFGLSTLYPIAIGLLSSTFGAAASRIAGSMFALSTLGGASVPWLVGYASTRSGSLRTALLVPLAGCLVIMLLFWNPLFEKRQPK